MSAVPRRVPKVEIRNAQMTVASYCNAIESREIGVNRNYQRSDKVWPPAARSFLIESILLGYPVPKMSLHQVTDVKTRQTTQEIVDGQQRSMAIYEFWKNGYRLSRTLELEEAAGKNYNELPDDLKGQFLGYGLSLDVFVSTTPAEVREVFRRINSYTIPLNPEEQRHATYQGPFKWFIHRLSRDFGEAFLSVGTFTPKQIVRMQDSKLLTEVCHAIFNGITTTSKASLDRLYREFDVEFPLEGETEDRLRQAVNFIVELPDLHRTELMKPYQIYALLLAVMHARSPIDGLQTLSPSDGFMPSTDLAVSNLTALAAAVDDDDEEGPFGEFVLASSSRTNVRGQREARFRWFFDALAGELPV